MREWIGSMKVVTTEPRTGELIGRMVVVSIERRMIEWIGRVTWEYGSGDNWIKYGRVNWDDN